MRRREFLGLVGGAAAWPVLARGQQQKLPVIGYLDPRFPPPDSSRIAAFREGLAETGLSEGRNVAIDFRWGNDDAVDARFDSRSGPPSGDGYCASFKIYECPSCQFVAIEREEPKKEEKAA